MEDKEASQQFADLIRWMVFKEYFSREKLDSFLDVLANNLANLVRYFWLRLPLFFLIYNSVAALKVWKENVLYGIPILIALIRYTQLPF